MTVNTLLSRFRFIRINLNANNTQWKRDLTSLHWRYICYVIEKWRKKDEASTKASRTMPSEKSHVYFNFPIKHVDWNYVLCYLCLQESVFKNFQIRHCILNKSKYVFFQKEYCFINNTCVQLAAINPENRCQECNPGRNNYQWSGIQGILEWKYLWAKSIYSDISVSFNTKFSVNMTIW